MRIWKISIVLLTIITFSWALFSIFKIASTTAPDFSVLWSIAKDYFKTPNPYLNPNLFTPSGYPPFTYLVYIPLTIFPFRIAQIIFTLISFISILGSVCLSLKLISKKVNLYIFLLASSLTLAAFPTKFTLGMGQINSIVFFLLLYSFYLYSKNKQVITGVLIGVAIVLKPILAFFLLFYLLKKEWKVIFYSLVTVSIGLLGSLIFYGTNLWLYWIKNIIGPLMNLEKREVYYNQGFLGFASRLTANISVRKLSEWSSLLFLVPLILYSTKVKENILTFSGLVISLLIIDSLSWQHHFIWLIFPFVVLSSFAIKFRKLWFWVLLGVSYLLVSWNFKNPSVFYNFPQSLILSNTFYGTIILYFLSLFCFHKIKKV